MGILDRLPERGLSDAIRSRISTNRELKGSFQAFGSSSVISRRIFSGASHDLQFTAPSSSSGVVVRRAEVEFKPDDMTFGGALCHRLLVRTFDLSGNDYNIYPVEIRRVRTSDGKQKWMLYFVTWGGGDSVRVKLYFFATGSGTFSVNVLN